MSLLKKIIVLLLLMGFYAPAFSAVDDTELMACGVYSEGEADGEVPEEEEPDCE